MDDGVAQFIAITNSSPEVAHQYLNLSDGRLEEAVQLFFDSGGAELEQETSGPTSSTAPPAIGLSAYTASGRSQLSSTQPQPYTDARGVVHLDSDDEMDDGVQLSTSGPAPGSTAQEGGAHRVSPPAQRPAIEDDEEIARRMQEELYAGAMEETDGVRAPLARTRETLVGPELPWDEGGEEEALLAARATYERRTGAHRRARELANRAENRPGIFNQLETGPSVWDDGTADPDSRRRELSRATAGASESSSKASLLAEMYRPPVEIISRLYWGDARDEGKRAEKWLLVNVQDPSIFDCQVLNRDIWKDPQIRDTIRENFIFMQFTKDDPRGTPYVQFYFKEKDILSAYPHIAIVDPRTGEQVKVWSGPPVPKPMDFLMQLHEFLDRFSLKPDARNPIPERRKSRAAPVDVDHMTEEQMLEMAMQNSLGQNNGTADDQLDDLDHSSTTTKDKGKGRAEAAVPSGVSGKSAINGGGNAPTSTVDDVTPPSSDSLFSSISSDDPHSEPSPDNSITTRIQFRHSGGRIIRRFLLADPVRRIYEWLKAEPLEGKEGKEFELVCAGRNLMDQLDVSIADAGLKNQTVMIEFLERNEE